MKTITYEDLKHCIKKMFLSRQIKSSNQDKVKLLGIGGRETGSNSSADNPDNRPLGYYFPEWANDWSIRYTKHGEERIYGRIEGGIIPESELIERLKKAELNQMGDLE